MAEGVLVVDDGPVRVVQIDRPQRRNAIDRRTGAAIRAAWEELDRADDLRVGVLTGAEGVFCAGADYTDMEDMEEEFARSDWGFMGFTRMLLDKPVIAAVSGVCAGIEVALWCDLRVADETAEFGFFARNFGRPTLDGGTQRLPRLIGVGRALELLLTGRRVDAVEALQIGLVNEVVPAGAALDRAVELAQAIAELPQESLRADRRALYAGLGTSLEEGLRLEKEIVGPVLAHDEARAGVAAFRSMKGRSRRRT